MGLGWGATYGADGSGTDPPGDPGVILELTENGVLLGGIQLVLSFSSCVFFVGEGGGRGGEKKR